MKGFAGVMSGLSCVIGGLLAGGVFGYFDGLNEAAHTPSAEWFDLRGLYAPVGALIGAVVGAAIGIAAAVVSAFAKSARYYLVATFLLLAGGVGGSSAWRYHAGQERYWALDQSARQEDNAAYDRQQANYARLTGQMSALRYPGSHLWPRRPGNPLSMTSGDTPHTVADYYARLLAVPLSGAPCGVGPSHVCWSAATNYGGAPLQITITDDDLNDGGKTSIVISTSDESPTAPTPVAAAPVTPISAPFATAPAAVAPLDTPSPAPPNPTAVSPGGGVANTSQADLLAAQREKIVKIRADLETLAYPGAQESPGGDSTLMLNFTTPDSVDAAGAYYRDRLGFPLRRAQSNGAAAWIGEAAYHDYAMHIAVFTEDGVTRIQMS